MPVQLKCLSHTPLRGLNDPGAEVVAQVDFLIENDLFIERFFGRYSNTLTVRQADALGGAGDDDLALVGRDAVAFERQHAEHRGVTGGADRHRLLRGELLGQRHEDRKSVV